MKTVASGATAREVANFSAASTTAYLGQTIYNKCYQNTCDMISGTIDTPIASGGAAVNLNNGETFVFYGASNSQAQVPIDKLGGLLTKGIDPTGSMGIHVPSNGSFKFPITGSIMIGEAQNLRPGQDRGEQVSNIMQGQSVTGGLTLPVINASRSISIPIDNLKEGSPAEIAEKEYIINDGVNFGGAGGGVSTENAHKVIGKGGWYDTSDKKK